MPPHSRRDFVFTRHARVLVGAEIAHRLAASRAHQRVLLASSGVAAIRAGERNCTAFNGVLAGAVTFRNHVHFTTKLLGWHGG